MPEARWEQLPQSRARQKDKLTLFTWRGLRVTATYLAGAMWKVEPRTSHVLGKCSTKAYVLVM